MTNSIRSLSISKLHIPRDFRNDSIGRNRNGLRGDEQIACPERPYHLRAVSPLHLENTDFARQKGLRGTILSVGGTDRRE